MMKLNNIQSLSFNNGHLVYISPELDERMKINNPTCPLNIQIVQCDICVAGIKYYYKAIDVPINKQIQKCTKKRKATSQYIE